MLFSSGFIALGFTAFFEPVVNEFGWSYAQVSLATSLRGVEIVLVAPLIGLLIDRNGPRRLMFWGIIIIGLGYLSMSRSTSLGMFYGSFMLVAIGMSGISYPVVSTAVANWFRKKVGIASGITFSGLACGGLLVPLLVILIDAYGWRFTTVILCLIFWVIGIPLTMIIKNKPEQYGYSLDGDQSIDVAVSQEPSKKVNSKSKVTAKQALKSHAFWHISASLTLNFISIYAVITHIMPYLSSIGITRSDSSLVAMSVPLISIVGRVGSGWLSDRFNNVKIAAILMVSLGIGVLLFGYAQIFSTWFLILFAVLFGIGWGGTNTIQATLLLEYFGRTAFGIIIGFSVGLTALGVVIGPLVAGWIFDTYSSYQPAWLLFTGLSIAAAIIMATTPRNR
jgi:sugar phosphate permease